ncbi:hypothetical protein R1sor_013180 [Riccia sorocarpa]|uniref:RING-type E3 ubiquitin transferase n=1 Tax=Riccia sorocarpa TaxID=122646 RepID=A0ABD3H7N6_9MARC
MEDCCAVCAEPLEWVGYGPCGHREVCYTCIVRLRFILDDKRCCICKQDCPLVYVTKALGEYTTLVTDWDNLPSRVGNSSSEEASLWYDNVVEAYFDDEQPYKTIKAMCKLRCSVCENASPEESAGKGMLKKGYVFRNIGSLRRHQFLIHKVYMCDLCLESRKVFISEQKLYTKPQLEKHKYKGDPEVDGTEEERGGFAGHPQCYFCKRRFYGDNELYQHMSQEHYTCHICQRARQGHYEYYRNYDDLEAHFRQEHLLCEHPDCLAKKFIVFPSEAELKRHNAMIHGGHMSRSQRNAALQIPVSFQFRRPGQDSTDDNGGSYSNRRGGRGRGGHSHSDGSRSNNVDVAISASVETAQLEEALRESATLTSNPEVAESNNPPDVGERGISGDVEVGPSSQGNEDGGHEPSRYLAAVRGGATSALGETVYRGGGTSTLVESAFPPLPGTSNNAGRKAKPKQGSAIMAALLGGGGSWGRGGIRVLNVAGQRRGSSSSQVQGRGQSSINSRTESSEGSSVSGARGRPRNPSVPGGSVTGGGSSSSRS